MGAYLGLRDSWLLEDDALLDAIEALQAQADGTFYPSGRGPESCAGIACRDLWGYLVPPSEAEAFERLFLTHEDERIAKLYAKRFVYARWRDGAESKPEVAFLPAPTLKETPLPGSVGKKATWARFWSWGPAAEHHFDMRCNLVTGRCSAEIVSRNETLPAARFRVAAAKIASYVTIGEGVHYGEGKKDPWMIYDGPYWDYILGTDDAVLLRGTRRATVEKGADPILSLLHSIKRSGRNEMRQLWGFVI